VVVVVELVVVGVVLVVVVVELVVVGVVLVVVVVELVVVGVVLVVVVLLVVVVVVVVVVGGGTHGGSAGFVQEQNVSPLILHCWTTALLQSLKAAPDKLPHAAVISSAHCFEPQSAGAAFAPETKTPAPSTTAANVTTAPLIIVIVKPPLWQLVAQHLLVGGAARRSDGEGAE
jgi:hypothetical protein